MTAKIEAIDNADAHATNAGLPSYTDLLRLVQRLAYKEAGELLTRDDYGCIARNVSGMSADNKLLTHQ